MPNTDISDLLARAVAAWKSMSPEEREAMFQGQRRSWVRGEMALGEWERSMTRAIR